MELEQLRSDLPDVARDTKINLQNVLKTETRLSAAQRYGVAVAAAIASRNALLARAVIAESKGQIAAGALDAGVIEDAKAAASLMAMNNVYYRWKHLTGKESYDKLPARLRMQRLAQVESNKTDFELFCLAVSAINGCGACMHAHDKVVLEGGLTEEHVQDAVRIAAVMAAAAVSIEIGALDKELA